MSNRYQEWVKDGTGVAVAATVLVAILVAIGVFAWWAFTWSTHTLAWAIFIFGSVLGSVKVRTSK